jgi:alpha-L-fucosidase
MQEQSFNMVSLVEPVGRWDDYQLSRISSYRFQHWDGAIWVTLAEGGSPAPTTIHRIPRITARRVRLACEGSHTPHIADIGVYDEPS